MTSVLLTLALLLPGQTESVKPPEPPKHELGVVLTHEEETALAFEDYQKQSEEIRTYTRYLSLRTVDPRLAMPMAKALLFTVPSVSRSINLDDQVPQRLFTTKTVDGKPLLVPTDLYRINLLHLEWGYDEWLKILGKYPYGYTENPIVIRGDWLMHELMDGTRSNAYYLLLYGEASTPKNAADFFTFFKVRTDQQEKLGFGLVAGESPVSIARERLIEHTEVDAGYAWQTFDVFELQDGKGPLDVLNPRKMAHNGTELIIGIPKVSVRQRIRGNLQVYQLGDDKDNRIEEANGRLVQDYIGFKHHKVIVNAGSCIQCHGKGINPPQLNGLEKLLLDGVELKAQDSERQLIERFHLTDVGKEIRRNQEDFASAVLACNGTDPETNAALFKASIDGYWSDLTLEQTAREVDSTPDELTRALAYASEKKLEVGARFAGLAHGRKISRATMETGYLKLREILTLWRDKS